MKRVIICIDHSPCLSSSIEAAVWIAKKSNRTLTLLHVVDYLPSYQNINEMSGLVGYEPNSMMLNELIHMDEQQLKEAKQQSQTLLTQIQEKIIQKYAMTPMVKQLDGKFLAQSLTELHSDDIVVLGKLGSDSNEKSKLGAHIEQLLRESKALTLVVGEHFIEPKGFLFAYDASPICQVTLKRIGQSELLKGLDCHLVHVGDEKGCLQEAAEYLALAGLSVQSHYLSGQIAPTLLQYLSQHHLDLLILGAFSHGRLYQFFLGSVTKKLLIESKVPVLVAR